MKEDVVLGVFPLKNNRRYHVLFSRKVVQLVDKALYDYGQQIDVLNKLTSLPMCGFSW